MTLIATEHLQNVDTAIAIADGLPAATLLLVISDPQQRQMSKLDMEAQGYSVVSASLGQDALKILQRYSVDLVIVDAMLPDMRGLDLIGKIAMLDSRLPIILRAPAQDLTNDFRYWAADAVISEAAGQSYLYPEITTLLQNRKSLH